MFFYQDRRSHVDWLRRIFEGNLQEVGGGICWRMDVGRSRAAFSTFEVWMGLKTAKRQPYCSTSEQFIGFKLNIKHTTMMNI